MLVFFMPAIYLKCGMLAKQKPTTLSDLSVNQTGTHMFKCIALLKRREDLSKEAFIEYYENCHAPLIRRLMPEIIEYRRNYIDFNGLFQFGGSAEIDFDSVTEIYFADRNAYERFLARNAEPDIAQQIANDEINLFERSATRMFVVEQHSS